jgi:hypothetical protein
MKFKLYREHGALNSRPIFDAIHKGLRHLGHEIVENDEDVAVVWSALWSGRMLGNKKIFEARKSLGVPTLFIEVGNLNRDRTWRIGIDHINGHGNFANKTDLDQDRPEKLGLILHDVQTKRREEILIACQHTKSLQWEGMPNMAKWVAETVGKIRSVSSRPIVVRPHPRDPFTINIPGIRVETPKRVSGTYDGFDIAYTYHCVVNHNSGPAIQAAIAGVPIVCDSSSLAWPVSSTIGQISHPVLPDRRQWFVELTHSEWTVEEIEQGIPFIRLRSELEKV